MSSRLRNCMVVAAVLVLAALLVVLGSFAGLGTSAEAAGEEAAAPIHVLAPFDMAAHRRLLVEIADEYAASPGGVPVEVQFIPQDLYKKEICMRMDQGGLADIIICENVAMPALIGMGIFSDITDYVREDQKQDHYYSIFWHNTLSDGRYYGLPFTCDPYVLYYNRTLFDRNGVKVPKTWDELREAAQEVGDLATYGLGLAPRQPEEVSALFLQLLASTGGSLRDLNGADGIRAFQLLDDLRAEKAVSRDTINWNQLDLAEAFMDGQVAMMVAPVSYSGLMAGRSLNFEVEASDLPIDKREAHLFHGKNIGVTATADQERAMAFLRYLAQPEMTRRVADGTDTIPVRADVPYSPEGRLIALDAEFVEKQVYYGMTKGSFQSWFDISGAISDGVHAMLSGTADPVEEVANTTQDRVRVAIL